MKPFFKGVRKHIGKLDAATLREQYERVSDEFDFFETTLKSIREGIAVLDGEGEIVYENPFVGEILGKGGIKSLELPLKANSKREIKISYPEERCLEVQTVALERESTLVVVRDVTGEKRHAEEALAAAGERAVRDLAAGVAHEIGNPLNALSLNLQLLERDHPGDETIGICRHQVARLDAIIRGFLQALRPARACLAPGNVTEPLAECLKALKNRFEEKRISVVLDMPAALPVCAIDKNQLEQVFFNLLKNAIEAMEDGGRLQVAVRSNDEAVEVGIRDSGYGMDDEQLKHLFEPYRSGKAGGTGLGLMITERIVREHGGTIAAESKKGEGTLFTVSIPRIEKRIRALNE